jgi:hypothetical protein
MKMGPQGPFSFINEKSAILKLEVEVKTGGGLVYGY